MSQKRKHADYTGGQSASGAAKKQKYEGNARQSYQKFKTKRPQNSSDEPKATSTSELRTRIRNLKRLLAHVDDVPKHKMPANVRNERERELETCEHELAEKTAAARDADHRTKMISKYHKIRFFDRQKATRILKKLQRQLSKMLENSGSDEGKFQGSTEAEVRQKIHNAEVDVNYAIYYPLVKAYSSLYPRGKEGDTEEKPDDSTTYRSKGDPEMWRLVERAMEQGTLNDLRESNVGVPKTKPTHAPQKEQQKRKHKTEKKLPSTKQKQQATRPSTTHQDDDDESDGDFFE